MSKIIGRVKGWNRNKSFGFICAEGESKDIYFNGYSVIDGELPLMIGSIVSFKYDKNGYGDCAGNIEILWSPEKNEKLCIGGFELPLIYVRGIGVCGGKKALESIGVSTEEMKAHGHAVSEAEYLFVSTADGEYRFFNEGSCIHGDGLLDIEQTYLEIRQKLFTVPEAFRESDIEVSPIEVR